MAAVSSRLKPEAARNRPGGVQGGGLILPGGIGAEKHAGYAGGADDGSKQLPPFRMASDAEAGIDGRAHGRHGGEHLFPYAVPAQVGQEDFRVGRVLA